MSHLNNVAVMKMWKTRSFLIGCSNTNWDSKCLRNYGYSLELPVNAAFGNRIAMCQWLPGYHREV